MNDICLKKYSMKLFFSWFLFSVFFSVNINAQNPAKVIPAFQFFRLDKTAFTNKDLAKGKPYFFIFFDASCDHCQLVTSHINQHHKDFKNASMYFITQDNRQVLDGFMSKYGKNLKGKSNIVILQDLNKEFIKKFGPRKYPSLFLYNSQQTLIMYDDESEHITKFSAALRK